MQINNYYIYLLSLVGSYSSASLQWVLYWKSTDNSHYTNLWWSSEDALCSSSKTKPIGLRITSDIGAIRYIYWTNSGNVLPYIASTTNNEKAAYKKIVR